jgi:hypothetical protein
MHAAQCNEQRVTVGLCLGERIRRHDAARAGAIVDYQALADVLPNGIGVKPDHRVRSASGWLAAQDQDRPRRIILCARDACEQHERRCSVDYPA